MMAFLSRTRASLPNGQPRPSCTPRRQQLSKRRVVGRRQTSRDRDIAPKKSRTTRSKLHVYQKNAPNIEIDQRRAVACRLAFRNRPFTRPVRPINFLYNNNIRIQSLHRLRNPVRAGIHGGRANPCPKTECTLGFWCRVARELHDK